MDSHAADVRRTAEEQRQDEAAKQAELDAVREDHRRRTALTDRRTNTTQRGKLVNDQSTDQQDVPQDSDSNLGSNQPDQPIETPAPDQNGSDSQPSTQVEQERTTTQTVETRTETPTSDSGNAQSDGSGQE